MVDNSFSLAHTARRILKGESYVVCIKEHVDVWNRQGDASLFTEEPMLVGHVFIDAWMGAAAEIEASFLGVAAPMWVHEDCRFLKEPFFMTDNMHERTLAMVETPSFFRNRLLFIGKTELTSPALRKL